MELKSFLDLAIENEFFMNPIAIIAGLFIASKVMKKKDGEGDDTAGSTSTTKPNIPGSPTLTVDTIHDRPGQLLDNVKYTFTAGGESYEGKHASRKTSPTQEQVGDYLVIGMTDPNIRAGEKKPDVIMLIVKDRDGRTIIAKRIIVGEKEIIDIQ